jgi:hypothetical protein
MNDLEDALAPLVENAPDAPAVEGVARRGRARRRRRTVTLATTLVLVVVVAIGAFATIANRGTPRVAGPAAGVEHVRVTLLDGSQLDISGPASLGLTKLPLSFNAELDFDSPLTVLIEGHSFTVERPSPELGTVLGRYPTHDGHELVVHETPTGADAVVQYGDWSLVVAWGDRPTNWSTWAAALNAHETPDGFLVVDPAPRWRLGPTDSPDVRIGDYGFFGPAHARCGVDALAPGESCRGDVLVRALDPSLADELNQIHVDYSPGR